MGFYHRYVGLTTEKCLTVNGCYPPTAPPWFVLKNITFISTAGRVYPETTEIWVQDYNFESVLFESRQHLDKIFIKLFLCLHFRRTVSHFLYKTALTEICFNWLLMTLMSFSSRWKCLMPFAVELVPFLSRLEIIDQTKCSACVCVIQYNLHLPHGSFWVCFFPSSCLNPTKNGCFFTVRGEV